MKRIRHQPSHAHAGQALAEFIVIALAMVPLFLIIPLIGKYQDISHKTQLASRYVAFEATTWNDSNGGSFKPEGQLADEVRRRFFSNGDAAIKTYDVAGNVDAHRNPLWVDHKNQPMIDDFANVQISFGPSGAATHASAFTALPKAADPFELYAPVVKNALGVQDKGIYTGRVSVKLATIAWPKIELSTGAGADPYDALELIMSSHTSVMTDAWPAKDANDVIGKINKAALFPAGKIAAVNSGVSALVTVIDPIGVTPPKLGELEFWKDVVPQDRLFKQ